MEIQVGNKMMEVTLLSKEGNHVKVALDEKVYDVDICMLEKNVYSIIHKGNSYNVELTRKNATVPPTPGGGQGYRANLNYSVYDIDILDSQAKYMRMRRNKGAENVAQANTITSPMPCKIVKVYVKPGDKLKAGDSVLTMEAMKMQSNYKVSADCVIKEVLVKEGDNVMANQTMVTVDTQTEK